MSDVLFGAAVFLVSDDRALMGLHRKENLWLPVGGKRELGESPLEAAQREVKEEASCRAFFPPDLTGIAGTPDGFFAYQEHVSQPSGRRVHLFAFLGLLTRPEEASLCSREFLQARWFSLSDLASTAFPARAAHVPQLARRALQLAHLYRLRTEVPEPLRRASGAR